MLNETFSVIFKHRGVVLEMNKYVWAYFPDPNLEGPTLFTLDGGRYQHCHVVFVMEKKALALI